MKLDLKLGKGIIILALIVLAIIFFVEFSPSNTLASFISHLPEEAIAVSLKPNSQIDFIEKNVLSGFEIERIKNKYPPVAVIYLKRKNEITSVNLYKTTDDQVQGKIFKNYKITGDPADLVLFKENSEDNNLRYLSSFANSDLNHKYLFRNSFVVSQFPYLKDYVGNEKNYLGLGWNTTTNSITFTVVIKDKANIYNSNKYFNLSDPTILAIGEGLPFDFILPSEMPPMFDNWLSANGIKNEAKQLQKVFNKSYVSFALLEWKGNLIPIIAGGSDRNGSEKINALKNVFNKYLSNKYSVPQKVVEKKGELIRYLKPVDATNLINEEKINDDFLLKIGCLEKEDALQVINEKATCDFKSTNKKIIALVNDEYFLISTNQELLLNISKNYNANNFQKNAGANFYMDMERLRRIPVVENNIKIFPEKNRTILESMQLIRIKILPQSNHTKIEGDLTFGKNY